MPPEAARLLYEDVATHVASLIERGALRAGDRLPSVRRFARERAREHRDGARRVSPAREPRADRDAAQVRSLRSARRAQLAAARCAAPKPIAPAPAKVTVSDGVAALVASMRDPSVVPLGAANLAPELYPIRAINRLLAGIVRDMGTAGAEYEVSPGLLTLRRQLARRSLTWGMSLGEDDFVITSGAMEAMHLALRVTSRARRQRGGFARRRTSASCICSKTWACA